MHFALIYFNSSAHAEVNSLHNFARVCRARARADVKKRSPVERTRADVLTHVACASPAEYVVRIPLPRSRRLSSQQANLPPPRRLSSPLAVFQPRETKDGFFRTPPRNTLEPLPVQHRVGDELTRSRLVCHGATFCVSNFFCCSHSASNRRERAFDVRGVRSTDRFRVSYSRSFVQVDARGIGVDASTRVHSRPLDLFVICNNPL